MADGSQLRRRVRMATADEPIDADSIANQAASELRQQIEASPIGERLDRVVAEDRPLASRAISAETPLVDEPDDSPSAREVSFHLAAPTGRGAVRSALRTPGIAADLRPSTPFGDDETGIAPEPEVSAKPEMADIDVLEPEQSDQPDRSPAGPDRDATAQGNATDELQELHKAQRHDRRARIGAGVLRGVQALTSLIGGAANIPGLSALGGLSGVASGVIPQGAGVADFEQRHGLRREQGQDAAKAAQAAYERQQDELQNERAERQLAVNVSNAEAGQANARARTDLERRAAEAEAREVFEKTDPTSTRAANQRGRFASLLEATVAARPDLQGVGERYEGLDLSGMNAEEIGTLIEDVQNVSRLPQGARIGRRGNGGRPGGPAPVAPQNAQQLEAAYNDLIATRSRQTGIPEQTLRAAYPDMAFALNPDEPRSLINASSTAATQDVNREQQLATQDQTMVVPGWVRREGAPRLSQSAADEARGRVSSFNLVSTFSQQMIKLSQKIGAMQAAGERADVISREVGRAAHIHEQLISALRELGNYGVPNGTEIERMERLAPTLTSARGILSAGPLYDGLRRVMWDRTLIKMRGDGYAPERRAR